jgi:hypothetical protein
MKKKSKPIPRSRLRSKASPMPSVDPVDITVAKARKLPMFGPGILVKMSLSLGPAYMELYKRVPMTAGEVRDTEERLGIRKPADVVWVKRVPTSTPQRTTQLAEREFTAWQCPHCNRYNTAFQRICGRCGQLPADARYMEA